MKRSNNKFGAISTKIDGHHFPSQLEAGVYLLHKAMVQSGEINTLRCQVPVTLLPGINWRLDFAYWDVKLGRVVYAEAKGVETERYQILKRIWRVKGPSLLRIYKGSGMRPKLVETLQEGTEIEWLGK